MGLFVLLNADTGQECLGFINAIFPLRDKKILHLSSYLGQLPPSLLPPHTCFYPRLLKTEDLGGGRGGRGGLKMIIDQSELDVVALLIACKYYTFY